MTTIKFFFFLNILTGAINVNQNNSSNMYRSTLTPFVDAPNERESMPSTNIAKSIPRSYSMPNVPIPPPMPPPTDSETPTPSGTLKRNMAAAGNLAGIYGNYLRGRYKQGFL